MITPISAPSGPGNDTLEITGPWFEDFHHGLEFDAPAVTLTAGHAALHQALFADRLRLPLDHAAAARVTGRSAPLCHPLLAVNIAIGQSTWASQRVKANLFYRGLVLRRPVFLGDTLHTRTRVVGLRQNRPQAGRAATGIVALEMTTTNQHGEVVLHFWRCPMIPCRDPAANTGHADELDSIGTATTAAAVRGAVPQGWSLAAADGWRGRRAADVPAGQRFMIEARDTITCAPELVRVSLNMAMAHTDSRLSYLGERLVFGGHTIFMCFAQLTRGLPNLLGLLAWDSCDHVAPVVEGDRLRTTFVVTNVVPLAADEGGGSLLRIAAECYAARGEPETETRVLDWQFWAWSL
jgi:2-methylfumaryl-CoA hydratase